MLPNFGWSTVGAEQNDPDTLNNLLFGPVEMTPSFNDLFPDINDEASSFGLFGSTRDDETTLSTNDSSSLFNINENDLVRTDFPTSFQDKQVINDTEPNLMKMESIFIPTDGVQNQANTAQFEPMNIESKQMDDRPIIQQNIPTQIPPLPMKSEVPSFPTTSNSYNPMAFVDLKSGSKKKLHNTSEKRRVERLNSKIDELYTILTSTGPLINKSKINILLETIKYIKHLQSQIVDLKEQLKTAQEKANRRLDQVNEVVASQKINYHVLFLQSPVPMAILSTDGQFIDANSQFCCLTKSTLDSLKTMTLFRFTHPEDLPCAFGSYSYMLHSNLESPSQCIIRHCVIGGTIQPVYFSLSLIRDKNHNPIGFTCTILPVLSCDCTGNCNTSRNCSGQLRSKQGKYYLICNPPDTIPCCSKLVGAISSSTESCQYGC